MKIYVQTKHVYEYEYVAALVIIVPNWKHLTCPFPLSEWIHQVWYSHTMENCSAIKRKEMLIQTTMWIHLKKYYSKLVPLLGEHGKKEANHCRFGGGSFNKQRALHISFALFGHNTKQISQTTHQNFKSLCRSLNGVQLCILSAGMLSCFSRVQLFVTLWTVAHQVPLSVEFSRQEYWNGLPFLPLGDLSDPGIKPTSPALAGRFFTH